MDKDLRKRILVVAQALEKLANPPAPDYFKNYKVTLTNIEWDTEDENGIIRNPKKLGLPDSFTVVAPDVPDQEAAVEYALDYASDETGWLIQGADPVVEEVA